MKAIGKGLLLAALAGAPGALTAQQPAQCMGMGMGHMGGSMPGYGHMGGMMPGMEQSWGRMAAFHAYTPAVVLEKKADLALTRDQVAALEALVTEVRDANAGAFAKHESQHAALVKLFEQPAPDGARARELVRSAMTAMADAHAAEVAAAARVKGLLSAEQRAKVDAWVAECPHRMPGAAKPDAR